MIEGGYVVRDPYLSTYFIFMVTAFSVVYVW